MVEQRVGERAHHRLGMTPANGLQGAPGVGQKDGLVSNAAKVPCRVLGKQLKNLVRPVTAHEAGYGGISRLLVPTIHRPPKGALSLGSGGNLFLIHRRHGPVALPHVACLRTFEVVQGPKNRQPTVGRRGGEAGQVGRVDHQHGVKLETD